MTPEEVKANIEQLEQAYRISSVTDDIRVIGRYVTLDDLSEAIKAIEKAEKYEWHDLRKNPEDLPEDNRECLVFIGNYMYYIDCKPFKDDVIAWREIEPFEEDE